jgi:hypothetical protein
LSEFFQFFLFHVLSETRSHGELFPSSLQFRSVVNWFRK